MKILILGAKGNLGTQLVKVFELNNEIIAWDREELDITNKNAVHKKIKNIEPDLIINTVAYNAVDKCEEDEKEFELAKTLNGKAVGYLADIAIEIDAILIHYSTDYVFEGTNTLGYEEDDSPNPINNYGKSKLLGEQEILARSNNWIKYYIIRTSKLFGPKGESAIAKPNFFDTMIKFSQQENQLEVVDEEESCFTYTTDLANATKKIIDKRKDFGIYHIINEGKCTWYEACKELFKIASIKTKTLPVSSDKFPRPAKRPAFSRLKNTKLEKLRTYQEALKDYLSK